MRWYSRVLCLVIVSGLAPHGLYAQSDVCQPPTPSVPQEARVGLMQVQAQERAEQEVARRSWEVKMFSVKNAIPNSNLQALCIFRIEVVPQPTLKLVAVRAPKELMGAIEDAIRRLDVPQPAAKNVELTAYVLVSSPMPQITQGLRPVPAGLQPVMDQLKSLLPAAEIFLADSLVVRGTAGGRVSINAPSNTSIESFVNLREGTPAVIRLENMSVNSNGANFRTSIDVPVGSQV